MIFVTKYCFFYVCSIDATKVDGWGKMVNDAPTSLANSIMKRHVSKAEKPSVHLCLFAVTKIPVGTELRFVSQVAEAEKN